MFSRIFIHRPIFASVISIVIVIIGSISMIALPIARYPEVAPPAVQVTTTFPGANAVTVAETVATPIEREVNGVERMSYMTSTSSADGYMQLDVTFEIGTDIDMANVLVQNRVSVAEPQLPQEVKRQGVKVKKKSNDVTLFISINSPGGTHDELYLRNYTSMFIKDEIARVNGVGDVMVFGSEDYGMRVWLNPDAMRARGLGTMDVVNAIREQNIEVAAGEIGGQPAPPGTDFQLTVNTLGRLSDVEQFEDIVVRTGDQGALTRVRDVARVELGAKSYSMFSKFNGKPATVLGVYQLPGSNAIEVAEGVEATMERLAESFPDDVEYVVAYDSTKIIRASMAEVVETLFITLILVIFTVFVFLQDWRATLVPVATIPVSLIGTFAVMLLLGFTINQLTLFGLVLVIGIVVDDAIVVVENVTRHIDDGLAPKEATELAMKEVTGPVIATTLVLLAVFVPTTVMGGITGQLFRQFAVTISIATVFSSINALTLSPALCGVLMRPSNPDKKKFFAFRWFDSALDSVTRGYVKSVKWAIRGAVLGIVVFAALIVGAIYGFGKLPTTFVPQEDEGWMIVSIQLPDGASLERTEAVCEQVEKIILETDGVEYSVLIGGYSLLDGSRVSSVASIVAVMTDWDERTTPELQWQPILTSINQRLAGIQDGVAVAFPPPSLPGVGMSGGFTLQLQDQAGVGLQMLQQVTDEFIVDGTSQSKIGRMVTGFRTDVPQLYIEIDREQVKEMGIPLQDVFDTLQAYLGSTYVNDFTYFARTFQVRAQAEAEFRAEAEDILGLEVRSPSGQMVPLGSLLEVQEVFGPQTVMHHNIYTSAKITGQGTPGTSSGEVMDLITQMARQKLPTSMGFEWTELSFQEAKAAGGTTIIFLFSIVLVYLVLAAQYESWTIPVSVCMAVPTALLGAVAALFIRFIPNSVYTQIGVVLLIGLSAKSAILIVEFAKVQREEGKSVFDSAVSAAQLRFRAVLMTAFSFILGVLPLLVATGAGSASRQAIGTAVFGGMVVATVVSVIAVPMLYFVVQWASDKLGGAKRQPD